MPRNKADVQSKHSRYASRMARGDTGKNYLNEFFGVVNQSVDGMLYEFGLFNDKEKSSPPRKPMQNQEREQSSFKP